MTDSKINLLKHVPLNILIQMVREVEHEIHAVKTMQELISLSAEKDAIDAEIDRR